VGLDHHGFELLERQRGNVERRGRLWPGTQALQHDGRVLSTLAARATTGFLAGSAATPAAQAAAAVHGYTTAFGWSAAIFALGAVVAAALYPRGVPQVAPGAEPAAAMH
jgi:cation transporter-like permease